MSKKNLIHWAKNPSQLKSYQTFLWSHLLKSDSAEKVEIVLQMWIVGNIKVQQKLIVR